MTSLAARLARPEIIDLPAFDLAESETDYGANSIKLDANENPNPPLVKGHLASSVNRYPEPQPKRLREAMAALYGIAPGQLVITRGADDAIDLLVRTFCRPGLDAIAVCKPSFSAYAHFARLQGARVVEASLDGEFDFEVDRFLAEVGGEEALKLVFLCSPNNPTGNLIDPEKVVELARRLTDTLVVLDEAYIEFAETESLARTAASSDNLLVLRTLSKAFGLAGARIGALVGREDVVALAAKALPPYPLSSLSIAAALEALSPSRRPIHDQAIEQIKAERERLAALLGSSPLVRSVRSGGGNFLFLEARDSEALAQRLRGLGIRARFRPNAAPGGVRLTIGTPAENDATLAGFGIAATSLPSRRATVVRDTSETSIAISVDLDRPTPRRIETGLGFFDHMLDQVAAHAGFSLVLKCEGDLGVDAHHSLEDVAIALGTALRQALGERAGIGRFGFVLPMDEAQAQVAIDLSGRPFSRFEGTFRASHVGDYPTEMTEHVFRSLAESLGAAIHVRVDGENDHHKTEGCFKAVGRALRQAIALEARPDGIPSTKGLL